MSASKDCPIILPDRPGLACLYSRPHYHPGDVRTCHDVPVHSCSSREEYEYCRKGGLNEIPRPQRAQPREQGKKKASAAGRPMLRFECLPYYLVPVFVVQANWNLYLRMSRPSPGHEYKELLPPARDKTNPRPKENHQLPTLNPITTAASYKYPYYPNPLSH